MRGLFNSRYTSGCRGTTRFQSALRMRGLFNPRRPGWPRARVPCFNPPCGCVAFSTPRRRGRRDDVGEFQSALRMRGLFNSMRGYLRCTSAMVSIRLADAWPFQRGGQDGPEPECPVSIRLADAWPFQPRSAHDRELDVFAFQSALRMRGLFNRRPRASQSRSARFQSALRMRGLFNRRPRRCRRRCWRFQSALRMRGLFNEAEMEGAGTGIWVSIRLADAWPFQRRRQRAGKENIMRFQSALRMRGLFNSA